MPTLPLVIFTLPVPREDMFKEMFGSVPPFTLSSGVFPEAAFLMFRLFVIEFGVILPDVKLKNLFPVPMSDITVLAGNLHESLYKASDVTPPTINEKPLSPLALNPESG